jgi:hypothetical protein
MAKIYAPNTAYNGETASVNFAAGVGETESPALIGWFKDHGYKVVEPEKAVDDMTVAELKAYADGKGIDLGDLTKKEDIIAKIKGGQ